jgi:arylsulfatase A-like enzyme
VTRKALLLVVLIALLAGGLALVEARRSGGRARPNVVLIVTDDSHLSEHDIVANMRPDGGFAWIRSHGVVFNRMWSTDNVCCPGRTTILTGQTAYNHGIRFANKTFKVIANAMPSWLQSAGYRTGFSGRYLNLYPLVYKSKRYARPPGWTYWEPMVDDMYQVTGSLMMQRDGSVVRNPTYQTDYLASVTRGQLDDTLDAHKPAFVSLWPLAPHYGATPKPEYAKVPVQWHNTDPSYNEADLSDKPPSVRKAVASQSSPTSTPSAPGASSDTGPVGGTASEEATRQIRTLLSVDDAVKSIIDDLNARHQLSNTVFILTSDNGYLLGEHGLVAGKEYAYEAAQIPLWIAGPGFAAGTKSDAFVTNLDIAPTIAKVAGALGATSKNGAEVDGEPIQDVLRDPQHGHERFLPLFVPTTPAGKGVKTWRYTYVVYDDHSEELYDLAVDPYELQNKAADAKYARVKADMRRLMERAITCKGASCRDPAPADLQDASMRHP